VYVLSFTASKLQAWRYKISLCQQIKLDARNKTKDKIADRTKIMFWI